MKKINYKIKTNRLKKLLRRIIDIYSPAGKEEGIQDFLYGYFKRHGLKVTCQDVDEDRYNLIIAPEGVELRLALIGHVDTIWAYDLETYCYEEDGDAISGLGSADMKGNCAAMIEAFISLYESKSLLPPVALALVVGEEEDGDGTKALVNDFYFPWAIIGEPTDLYPCMKHFGYMEVQICTKGKRMHASLANLGQNAIESMLNILLKISQHMNKQRPDIVYNIRDLSSSRSGFAVPDRCESWLDLHLPPGSPLGEITLELEEILSKEQELDQKLDAVIRFNTMHSGYDIPEKGNIIENLKSIYKKYDLPWEGQTFRSHSDANILWTAGIKPILLGAGQLEKAHTPEESISFNQVCLTSQIYFDILHKFL